MPRKTERFIPYSISWTIGINHIEHPLCVRITTIEQDNMMLYLVITCAYSVPLTHIRAHTTHEKRAKLRKILQISKRKRKKFSSCNGFWWFYHLNRSFLWYLTGVHSWSRTSIATNSGGKFSHQSRMQSEPKRQNIGADRIRWQQTKRRRGRNVGGTHQWSPSGGHHVLSRNRFTHLGTSKMFNF